MTGTYTVTKLVSGTINLSKAKIVEKQKNAKNRDSASYDVTYINKVEREPAKEGA